jgi:hypothetical protein
MPTAFLAFYRLHCCQSDYRDSKDMHLGVCTGSLSSLLRHKGNGTINLQYTINEHYKNRLSKGFSGRPLAASSLICADFAAEQAY